MQAILARRRATSRGCLYVFGGTFVLFGVIFTGVSSSFSKVGNGFGTMLAFGILAMIVGIAIIVLITVNTRKRGIANDISETYLRFSGPARIVEEKNQRPGDDYPTTYEYVVIDDLKFEVSRRDLRLIGRAINHYPVLTAEYSRTRSLLFELWDAWGNRLYCLPGYVPDSRGQVAAPPSAS
jgi:hypothetical protein